ncbi:MAG: hypothetical protein R2716_02065 [Microthrixaceae bacterium]
MQFVRACTAGPADGPHTRRAFAMSQESFGKRQREKARKEKAAAKAARRAERNATAEDTDASDAPAPVDEQLLLAELADLHARFDNDAIGFEDFSAAKEEIVQRLQRG